MINTENRVITPQWAAQVLRTRNKRNRNICEKHVSKLVEDMKSGRWKENGDTISFDTNDNLLDGQHRLAAVSRSGMSVKMLVVTGLSPDVFDTKDIGRKRSPGDTLSVLGEENCSRLAAALATVDRYYTNCLRTKRLYTNIEIEELLRKYPGVRSSLQTTHNSRTSIVPPSILDACHYIFSRKDRELADEFVEKMMKGSGLTEDDPWYILRERLLRNKMSKAKLDKVYIMALCIKAWNYARTGRKVRAIKFKEDGTEAFPVAV